MARHKLDGKSKNLGSFSTAVDAAVAYAKYVQSLSVEDEGEEGGSVAAAGMRLRLAKPVMTGYRGVRSNGFKRFTAEHRSNGKRTHLGTFDTAMEAAVAYAKCVQLLNAPKADARAGDHNRMTRRMRR